MSEFVHVNFLQCTIVMEGKFAFLPDVSCRTMYINKRKERLKKKIGESVHDVYAQFFKSVLFCENKGLNGFCENQRR